MKKAAATLDFMAGNADAGRAAHVVDGLPRCGTVVGRLPGARASFPLPVVVGARVENGCRKVRKGSPHPENRGL